MKIETKSLDKCKVEIAVALEADAANAIVKETEKFYQHQVALPGFRKGKVPMELIRKNFASQMENNMREKFVENNCQKAVEEAGLTDKFVALVDVKDFSHDANGAAITFVIEVAPTFKLPTYKGLKVTFNDTKVKDEEVEAQLKRLREACAKYEEAKDGETAADGDFVQITFSGTIDGKPVAETAPDAKFIGEASDFWTQINEGRFIPEVLDALKGMKVGDKKEGIKVKFEKDFHVEALRGKKAVYAVEVKALRKCALPDDAALLEQLKPQYKENAESIEKLTDYLRNQMQSAADERELQRREEEALGLLCKKVNFDLPSTPVMRTRNAILQDYAQRAQNSGYGVEYFQKNRDKILKEVDEAAERQVRIWYILSAIAKAEKIEGEDNEIGKKVVDFILANAKK